MKANQIIAQFLLLLSMTSLIAMAGVSEHELDTKDGLRQYRQFVPSTIDTGIAIPLVLNFHGTGGTPERQAMLSEIERLAETDQFIVVSPQAIFSYEVDGPKTWNVEKVAGGADDVAFIALLIDTLSKQLPIAKNQVYATGFSGGARMSSRLGCDLSDKIAAIAPVAGLRFPADCHPTNPMPIISFHGKLDPVNHYTRNETSPRYWNHGVEDAVSGWLKINQCSIFPDMKRINNHVQHFVFNHCSENLKIEFYLSDNAGHTWPGSPMAAMLAKYGMGETDTLPGSQIIWEFLNQHQR